ncbi:MAG: short-subunit dehydrogenase [Halioglobus sp.]
MTAKVVLITGTSSGLGKACAEHLANIGYTVYGTSRKPCPDTTTYRMLAMDVTDQDSVNLAVNKLMHIEGRIDVLVNNAGSGIAGALEDTSIDELRFQFDANCFGVMRVCHKVLPIMRAQNIGHIINMASIAGLIPVPFQGAYSASKSALQSLTEVLRMEVKSFGVQVALVEPGDFCTDFTANRLYTTQSQSNEHYREACKRAVETMEEDERNGCDPIMVARLLEKIIAQTTPRLRYTVGPRLQVLAVHLRKVMPSRLFQWLIMKIYKL